MSNFNPFGDLSEPGDEPIVAATEKKPAALAEFFQLFRQDRPREYKPAIISIPVLNAEQVGVDIDVYLQAQAGSPVRQNMWNHINAWFLNNGWNTPTAKIWLEYQVGAIAAQLDVLVFEAETSEIED